MSRWFCCIDADELECAFIHPFVFLRMAVSKAERACLDVVRSQGIIKGLTAGIGQAIHAASHRQMPSPFVFSILTTIVFLLDEDIILGRIPYIKHP